MTFQKELSSLFKRDLERLRKQIDSFPNDESPWVVPDGVTNSGGNLALHLEGNLREFVGRQLGKRGYQRERPLEFSTKGLSKPDLMSRIDNLIEMVPAVISSLSSEEVEKEYPEVVLDAPMSTRQFLIHLYGHLSWHLGQIDYVRRISDSRP